MKAYIKYIGIFDRFNNCHSINLDDGLNIITGRSSTGKSAIIEIFDYCTGNPDNTIPEGIITDSAFLYFVVFETRDTNLVLARKQQRSNTVFYKVDPNFPLIEDLKVEYFTEDYFLPLKSFKETLGHFWGIDISITDENEEAMYNKNKKRSAFI